MYTETDIIFQGTPQKNIFDQIDDYAKGISRYVKRAVKTKKFKIEEEQFVNDFIVHFTAEGEAIQVEIQSTRKVDPREEQINHLQIKLREAVNVKNYAQVVLIGKELEALKNQQEKTK